MAALDGFDIFKSMGFWVQYIQQSSQCLKFGKSWWIYQAFFRESNKNMFAEMNTTTQQNLGCIEANDIWLNLYPFHVFKQTQGRLPLGFATGQQCVEGDVTWLYLRVLAALVPGMIELEALHIPNLHLLPMPKRQFSRIFPPFTLQCLRHDHVFKTAIACCQFC